MRIVGNREEQPITFDASGDLLLKGMEFNTEMNNMFNIKHNGIPKGIYRFKNHAEADDHKNKCIAENMARIALEYQNV